MQRIGKFYMTTDFVFESEIRHEVFSQLMFVPLRAEHLAYMNKFELIGLSPFFNEISEGSVAPEYTIIIEQSEDDEISVTTKLVEE